MRLDDIVHFGAVKVLQEEVRDYIKAHVINERYVGKLEYLKLYADLSEFSEKAGGTK